MRTIALFLLLFCFFQNSVAQESKYIQIMEENVNKIDSAESLNDWLAIANTMERIAEKEKDQWLPAYYASYCYLMTGIFTEKKKDQEAWYSKADEWIQKCEKTGSIDSAEVLVLKANIWQMQISLKPMKLGQTLGPLADMAMKDAEKLSPENPRVHLLKGQNAFYTPPMFGGDKDFAYECFLKAKDLFGSFKAESTIHPRWGIQQTEFMIQEYEKEKDKEKN